MYVYILEIHHTSICHTGYENKNVLNSVDIVDRKQLYGTKYSFRRTIELSAVQNQESDMFLI